MHVDAPDFEVADARKLLDLLASRPEVLKDGPGDPRVGVVGGSYGGALALLLAGYDRRVDAIAPQITWNDLRQALFPQFAAAPAAAAAPPSTPAALVERPLVRGFRRVQEGLGRRCFFGGRVARGRRVRPLRRSASAAACRAAPAVRRRRRASPHRSERPGRSPAAGASRKDVCDAYVRAATTGAATPEGLRLLEASSPATVLGRITAPTLLVQGEADSLFPLSEGDANARGIAANGTPVKVVWYGGGHDGGLDETDRLRELVRDWFGHYLKKDGSPADTRFEVTVPAATISSADSNPAPPGASARRRTGDGGLAARATAGDRAPRCRGQPDRGPGPARRGPRRRRPRPPSPRCPGSAPRWARSAPPRVRSAGVPGTSGAAATGAGSSLGLSALPDQVAVFESATVPETVRIVGSPEVSLHVSVADTVAGGTTRPCSPSCTTSLPAARPPCPSSSSPRCG